MKVKIGTYPSRIRSCVYTDYMTKKYGYVAWPKVETRFEKFLEKVEDFLQTCYSPINYFLDKRVQKVSVKIDRWDTWSMDHTLSYIIVPMLKQLQDTKHGAPMVDNDDVPEDLRMPKDWYEDKYKVDGSTDPYFFDRWDWVLEEMIWAFEQKTLDSWEEQYYEYETDPTAQFGVKCVWSDDEGRKAHQERMTNGFRLFGKYYESLWD
jgi:hypothetical protein